MSEELELSSLEFPGDPSTFPTSRTLPCGDILMEIKAFKAIKSGEPTPEAAAQGKKGGKLGIAVSMIVHEPEEQRGIPTTHTFWIGTDADPSASQAGTWKSNATGLMNLFKQAKVAVTPSSKPAELMAASVGQIVGASVKMKQNKRINPKTGDLYPARAEIANFYMAGAKPVNVVAADEQLPEGGF